MTGSLALQLVLRGDRAGRVRLLLMTSGVALGVALLLGVAGVLPAVEARQQVLTNRTQTYDAVAAAPRTEGVAALAERGFWRSRELHSLRFTVVGPPVTPPEGVRALPGDGEVLVSPALRAAMAGPHGDELRARVPGRVTGTVGDAGLTGPDELFFVAPAETASLSQAGLGEGFTPKADAVPSYDTTREELRVAVPLAGIALVVPILVLISTSTRLSAATRERRTAAVRLVGATRRQVAQLAVVEGAVVGVLGAVAGLAVFLLLRGPATGLLPVPDGVHAASLRPGAGSLLLALVGVPLLAAVTAPLSLRRVVSTPLGVSRQARLPKAGPARLVPLAAGVLLLVLADLGRGSANEDAGPVTTLLVGGAALSLVGLAVAGPALARAGGLALSRWGPGPASQLAGRRLVLDPSAAARTVTGTALVVAVGGWVLAFLPVLDQAQHGYLREGTASIRPGTVVAGVTDRRQAFDAGTLEGVDGVRAVVTVADVSVVPEGTALPLADPGAADWQPVALRAVVADCAALAQVLASPLEGCRPGQVQLVELALPGQEPLLGGLAEGGAAPRGRFTVVSADGQRTTGQPVEVAPNASRVRVPATLGGAGVDLGSTLLLPPTVADVSGGVQGSSVLVATDGSDAAVEAARTALSALTTQAPPLTPAEAVVQASRTTDAYRTAALVGLVVVVLAGGVTVAVGTADGLRERHRAHAALLALGTPMAVLRRSVVLQIALPLALSVGAAVASSAVAARVYLALGGVTGEAGRLPSTGYGAVAGTAVLATLLATAAALPLLRSAGRPGALRTE